MARVLQNKALKGALVSKIAVTLIIRVRVHLDKDLHKIITKASPKLQQDQLSDKDFKEAKVLLRIKQINNSVRDFSQLLRIAALVVDSKIKLLSHSNNGLISHSNLSANHNLHSPGLVSKK